MIFSSNIMLIIVLQEHLGGNGGAPGKSEPPNEECPESLRWCV